MAFVLGNGERKKNGDSNEMITVKTAMNSVPAARYFNVYKSITCSLRQHCIHEHHWWNHICMVSTCCHRQCWRDAETRASYEWYVWLGFHSIRGLNRHPNHNRSSATMAPRCPHCYSPYGKRKKEKKATIRHSCLAVSSSKHQIQHSVDFQNG